MRLWEGWRTAETAPGASIEFEAATCEFTVWNGFIRATMNRHRRALCGQEGWVSGVELGVVGQTITPTTYLIRCLRRGSAGR
jgi:hypothetical protein